jgi:hypothetical protein
MQIATHNHDAAPVLNATGQTTAQLQTNTDSLMNGDDVECRFWRVDTDTGVYGALESLCYMILLIAGIGTVLYSASTFLYTAF